MNEVKTRNNEIGLQAVDGITQTILAEGTAAQEYYKAETLAITTAEGQLQKAKTFKEKQYWYEKMEQHTAALGSHNDTVLYMVIGFSLAGLILYCCPMRGAAYGK